MNPFNQKFKTRSIVMGLFGLCVMTSGMWRFFSAEGGHAGLTFGLVMGGIALLSAFLFKAAKPKSANLAGWLSILFVGGWFCYESFIKKGLANAEPRQLLIIAITFLVAGVMVAERSGRETVRE